MNLIILPILKCLYLDSFFVDDDLEVTANKQYDFYLNTLLYYQKIFEYNGNVLDLLQLPYNLFQDLILKQIELKKKEIENERKQQLNAIRNKKDWRTNYKPLKADFL